MRMFYDEHFVDLLRADPEKATPIIDEYRSKDWREKEQDISRMVSEVLNTFVNGGNRDSFQTLVEEIKHWHPTLQQCLFGICTMLIKMWSEKEYVDGRLEYTHDRCKELMKALEPYGVGAPLI